MDQTTMKILCVTCPKGCSLEVTREGETVIEVKPGCKRGHEYVARELTDPRRMVATTVKVKHGNHPLLPVYTRQRDLSRSRRSNWPSRRSIRQAE